MNCVVAGPMLVEETTFEQVGLPRRRGLIDGYGQVVTRIGVRAAHPADDIEIATPHIGVSTVALEEIDAR